MERFYQRIKLMEAFFFVVFYQSENFVNLVDIHIRQLYNMKKTKV